MTHHEVASNVGGLVNDRRRLWEEKADIERGIARQQSAIEKEMPKLKKLLNLGKDRGNK